MKSLIELPQQIKETLEEKWLAFYRALGDAGLETPKDSEFINEIKQVFFFSDFVSKTCTRKPSLFIDLMNTGDLQRKNSKDGYHDKLSPLLENIDDENQLGKKLIKVRQREMIRIAWRDLTMAADLRETLTDLSALADACVDKAFLYLYRWHCEKYGTPTGPNGSKQNIVVLALGKLGAGELNFSSDIDLVFGYPESGETKGGRESITNEAFFTYLSRSFLKLFSTVTSDGILFRVDLRLRPFGENGPMVMNFNTMLEYFERQGREWERYAFIKARAIAGDKEAGNQFLIKLKPFVYRRYLDYGTFDSLRDMKQKISLEVDRKGLKENIKLGPGGIREIEFFGQVFQLIRGGVEPELQEQQILKVLEILAKKNNIPRSVYDELSQAYEFLRLTENRLQEFSDQQTHDLPTDDVNRLRLALSMGYCTWEKFLAHKTAHTQNVHRHFSELLTTDEDDSSPTTLDEQLKRVWKDEVEKEIGEEILLSAGFDNPDDVIKILLQLKADPETRALSRDGRDRLNKLLPLVLKKSGSSENPHIALKRIIDLIKAVERRTCYLALLLENPNALTHLVKLSIASSWIISFLSRHPVLLDELLDQRTLYVISNKRELEEDLRLRMARVPDGDLEYQIEELCIFKQVNTLHVATADISGTYPLMKVSDHLTDIAEIVLNKVIELSWNHLIEKHGKPVCLLNDKVCEKGFTVIGYGKLGGIELGYRSDLDMVFLHAGTTEETIGGIRPIDTPQFFARLGQRVLHILSTPTRAGSLYETDMRLRPNGNSGILVSHTDAYKEYQEKKAWTWEHQALVRARVVGGDRQIAERFEEIRKEILARPRSKEKLLSDVKTMRDRMRTEQSRKNTNCFDLKQAPGGIVDIEFLVQYLVLRFAHEHIELVTWTDNVRLLETLTEAGVLKKEESIFLKEAYLSYRGFVHKLNLQEKPATVPHEKFKDLKNGVIKIWNEFMESGR